MKVGDRIKLSVESVNAGMIGIILKIAPPGFMYAESGLVFQESNGRTHWTYQYMCEVLPKDTNTK